MIIAVLLYSLAIPGATAQTTIGDEGRSIYVEGYITGLDSAGAKGSYPIPGAIIYFIKDQQIVNQSKANAIGYYSVVITPGTYSVVCAASGFQTLMDEQTFKGTRTLSPVLVRVPYNGLVTYAVNPVVETSPGRPVSVTIAVENSQLADQYVGFTLQAPETDTQKWGGWCPDGEMIGIRSGDMREATFLLQYNGGQRGAYLAYVLVTGGAFYSKIPIVIVVKDMPYESLDLYANSPEKTVRAGDIAHFLFSVNNGYARDKPLELLVEKPEGWGATTGNGTAFYAAECQVASSDFWVYVPRTASPGNYTVNLTLKGEDVISNKLMLHVRVTGLPAYEALIRGYKVGAGGYPSINLTGGDAFDIPIRIYNDGDFPLVLMATAEVGDNWAYYLSGAPWGRITIEPGAASEFVVHSRAPNGTAGNYTATIYLDYDGQTSLLMAELTVRPPEEATVSSDSLGGLLLAGGTAGVIAISLIATTRKRRRY